MKKEIFIKGVLSEINKILPIKEQYELRQYSDNVAITFNSESENKILRYLFKNGAITITKDNIAEYYEFMSDEDLIKNKTIISDIFDSRKNTIPPFFKDIDLKSKGSWCGVEGFNNSKQEIVLLPMTYGHYTLKQVIFGVKDTLKPVDEYIAEIKASEEYKNYIFEDIIKSKTLKSLSC